MLDKLIIPNLASFKVHLAIKKIEGEIYCAVVAPDMKVGTSFVIDEVTATKISNVLSFAEKVK